MLALKAGNPGSCPGAEKCLFLNQIDK
jgi:hypothetical protein